MAEQILYVEDNDFFSQVVSDALQKKGYEVTIARDGEEGLHFLEHNVYNLVFLDLLLPKIDGFELLKRMRDQLALNPIPIIAVLSNISGEDDIKRAKELGVTDFLVKATTSPEDISVLAERLLSKKDPSTP
ncbi:MAG TPA: response regulator [Candidatus Paceibacterota bacterium]